MSDSEPEEKQPSTKIRWTAEIANEVINRWKKSGLSQTAFCRQQEISLTTLNYWIRKTRRPKRQPRKQKNQDFVEVKNPKLIVTPSPHTPIELVTPSGFKLNLPSGFSSKDLHQVLSALKVSSC